MYVDVAKRGWGVFVTACAVGPTSWNFIAPAQEKKKKGRWSTKMSPPSSFGFGVFFSQ